MAPKDNSIPSLQYHVFEVLPNGSIAQRASVHGLEAAWQNLYELADHTTNECFAIHPPTHEVVAQVNVPPTEERARKWVFQIAYTEELGITRAEVLTRHGYRVTTVIGNERARVVVLMSPKHYDLFIIGHGAPEQTREEMVAWLKVMYPRVKILALNPIHQRLYDADYNVPLNSPEKWVPVIVQALA